MRSLALASLVVACNEGTPSSPIRDGGALDAGRSVVREVDTVCVPTVEGSPFSSTVYTLELADLCAMLAVDGGMGCPPSRSEFVQGIDCSREGYFEVVGRCALDTFGSYGDSYTFDHAGVLVGADVAGSFRCGRGIYRTAAPAAVTCEQPDRRCPICVRGPESECPADVLAAFPGNPCVEPTDTECAPCDSTGFDPGTPCLPSCESCAGGTCWTQCTCHTDGVYRTVLACTE
jgi:hypothetical protein